MASKLPDGKAYIVSHAGQSAIICGSAPCLFKEFEEASHNMPDAKVFVVNEAAHAIWGDFLVSYHSEKMAEFKEKSKNPDIMTITSRGYAMDADESQIDYRFQGVRIGATSVGDAVQIAQMMQFDNIVMVGAPMNGRDGYYNEPSTSYICPRFGDKEQGESNQVNLNKAKLASLAPILSKVKSMSGYSKEILGGPAWQTQT